MVNLNNLIQFPFKINVIVDTNNITKLSYNIIKKYKSKLINSTWLQGTGFNWVFP
jgi:hypothetical protein